MYLIQVLLPLFASGGRRIPKSRFDAVARQLTTRFGGLTAYTRAPAKGLWKPTRGSTQRDDVVIYEVMSSRLDRKWWTRERKRLERDFRQQEILIRAQRITKL